MATFTEIPIVDLAPIRGDANERTLLAEHLQAICHEVGFFVVVNHGIDPSFIDSIFDMMGRFFALPEEQKRLIDKQASRHFRGWEAIGSEYTNNRPDIREQIDLWSEWPARPTDTEPNYLRLLGPNQWLPAEVLPEYRPLMTEWYSRLGALADQLLGLLSLGLGLSEGHLQSFFGDEPMSLTKLISYPPTPEGQAGVNAHHDAGFLTVLAAGSTPGLEVQNTDGDWIPVPPLADSFVINLGEMLQGMTGNYFVATPHRVITTESRLSAGYFHGPSLDASLAPLPLAPRFAEAVASSPHHSSAGFMARRDETEAGVGDMGSAHRPAVYGEQLWNYFARSYPQNMERHYGDQTH